MYGVRRFGSTANTSESRKSVKIGTPFSISDTVENEKRIGDGPTGLKAGPSEIAELAKWFEEFHAQMWDQQIERDLKAGRLDSLLEEAKQDLESHRCEPL